MASPLEWIALGALLARPETLAETESRLWQTLEIRHAIESLPGDTVPLRHLLETHGCVWTGKGKSIDAVMESMLDAALEWHARRLNRLRLEEQLSGKPKVETQIVEETLSLLRVRHAAAQLADADAKTTDARSSAVSGTPTAEAPSTPPKSKPLPKPPSEANPGSQSSKPSGKGSGKSGKPS